MKNRSIKIRDEANTPIKVEITGMRLDDVAETEALKTSGVVSMVGVAEGEPPFVKTSVGLASLGVWVGVFLRVGLRVGVGVGVAALGVGVGV